MGLDTVELVMAIEDEFGINVANEDASRLATVGDIYVHFLEKLNAAGMSLNPMRNYGEG